MNRLIALVLMIVFSAPEARAALSARLGIPGIAEGKRFQTCERFQGARQGSTVWLEPVVTGGSGRYEFTLAWRFGSGYRDYGVEAQFERRIRPGKRFGLMIPFLRDDVPYVQQAVVLLVRDRETGETANAEALFPVSRNVILTPSSDPAVLDRNCFERFAATESMIGVLTNGSTNVSSLSIKQGIDRLWANTNGTSWGFYISPFAFLPGVGTSLAGLFMANRSYYKTTSRQTSETVEVNASYNLSPGDTIQIYTQKTRYITHYDATLVDACGARASQKGAYPLQWWGFAYHAVPVNPYDPTRPNINNIGAAPVNTCPASLTPDTGAADGMFFQTNL